MKRPKITQADYALNLVELEVLSHTLLHKEVKKVFIAKGWERANHPEDSAKLLLKRVKEKLKWQYVYRDEDGEPK
jgi:hypothetical protein